MTRIHRRHQTSTLSGWLFMRLGSIAFSGYSILNDRSCRFSHTKNHSSILLADGPHGHQTERFLAYLTMSGCLQKSVGSGTRQPGHISQTSCPSLRQLHAVGSPRHPKQLRTSSSTVQSPPKNLHQLNRLLHFRTLCMGRWSWRRRVERCRKLP